MLDASIQGLVEEARALAKPGLHKDGVLDRLAACYAPGETMGGAFARLLSSLFPELVILDPSDPELKALMVPVLQREIREGSPTSRLALETGQRLLAAGYHQQVPVRPGFLNLFVVMDGERRALGFQDGSVEVRGTGRRMTVEEAVRALGPGPPTGAPARSCAPSSRTRFSPPRPTWADPAEIAYHAQIVPSYAHFGVARPVLLPRPSATILEPAQARALEAEHWKLTDLQDDPEALVARWAKEAYPEVEGAFTRAREAVERELQKVEETLGALDPTLRGAADATRGRALHPSKRCTRRPFAP